MTDCFDTAMQRAKAHMEKGDQSKEKADQHYISAGLELKVAKENLPVGLPWAKAVLDYGIHKTRANQLIRIADGRTTLEAENERSRASTAETGRKLASTPPLISQDNPEQKLSRKELEASEHAVLVRYYDEDSPLEEKEQAAAKFLIIAVRRVEEFVRSYEREMKTKREKTAFRRELAKVYGHEKNCEA